jgi:hypothetical protein
MKQEGKGRQKISSRWLSDTPERNNGRQEQDKQPGPENGRLCWYRRRERRSGKRVMSSEAGTGGWRLASARTGAMCTWTTEICHLMEASYDLSGSR